MVSGYEGFPRLYRNENLRYGITHKHNREMVEMHINGSHRNISVGYIVCACVCVHVHVHVCMCMCMCIHTWQSQVSVSLYE